MTQLTATMKATRRQKVSCLACHRSEIGVCPHHLDEANAARVDRLRACVYAVFWCALIAGLLAWARC